MRVGGGGPGLCSGPLPGGLLSNTCLTYPGEGDNPGKIPEQKFFQNILRKRKDKRYKQGFQTIIKLTIHNKNKKVLEKIRKEFGGNLYFHTRDKIWYLTLFCDQKKKTS